MKRAEDQVLQDYTAARLPDHQPAIRFNTINQSPYCEVDPSASPKFNAVKWCFANPGLSMFGKPGLPPTFR